MEEENLLSPAPRPSRKRRAPELFVPSAEKAAIKAEIKAAVRAEIVELEKQSKKSRKRPAAAAGQKTKKKASSSSSSSKGEPYPDYALPLPHHCLVARDALAELHGYVTGGNPAEETDPSAGSTPPPPPSSSCDVESMCHLAAAGSSSSGSGSSSGGGGGRVKNEPNTHLEAAAAAAAAAAATTTTGKVKAHRDRSQSVLDSLVRTILSQNTTDRTSARAFASLKEALPTWEAVLAAPNEEVEDAIREGGLAEIKTARIKAILERVRSERLAAREAILSATSSSAVKSEEVKGEEGEEEGLISLEHLRLLPTDEVKRYLTSFKGVGPKTVSCVLMFTMGRAEFPVDTHVWHMAKKLRWVPPAATRETTYEHLNRRVPDDLKYDLHVLLVDHGKRCRKCCKDGRLQKESHGDCPLSPASLCDVTTTHRS